MTMKKLDDFKQIDGLEIIDQENLETIKGGNWWAAFLMWVNGGCPPPWEEEDL